MIQERFNLTVGLIRRQGECFPFLNDLLRIYDSTVLVFSFSREPSLCFSMFVMEEGTYIILSDFELHDLVYAFHATGTPEHAPVFSHLFLNGKLLSRERE